MGPSRAGKTLAYLFWHWPAFGRGTVYEATVGSFHAALGRPGSVTFRVLDPAPFPGAGTPLYLDWYPVGGWTDLGVLNAEAVTGPRREPHAAAAALSGGGHGELRALVAGAPTSESGHRRALVRQARR